MTRLMNDQRFDSKIVERGFIIIVMRIQTNISKHRPKCANIRSDILEPDLCATFAQKVYGITPFLSDLSNCIQKRILPNSMFHKALLFHSIWTKYLPSINHLKRLQNNKFSCNYK